MIPYIFFIVILLPLFWATFRNIVEPIAAAFTGKPLFLYFYPILKKLDIEQQLYLQHKVGFYQRLSNRHQRIFDHRVLLFISKYQFFGKGGIAVTAQMKLMVAASFVKLTFGMRIFLVNVFERIIIYPNSYESTFSNVHHNGEFNPKLKTVVFSWTHFEHGFEFDDDNVNLGLHEFTHVMQFHAMKARDISAQIFAKYYNRIMIEVKHAPNAKRLIESDYFRIYAYTNEYEFLAVIVEHFFETPRQFEIEFPQLYHNVKKMLNFRD